MAVVGLVFLGTVTGFDPGFVGNPENIVLSVGCGQGQIFPLLERDGTENCHLNLSKENR